jgi:hypothetical protein
VFAESMRRKHQGIEFQLGEDRVHSGEGLAHGKAIDGGPAFLSVCVSGMRWANLVPSVDWLLVVSSKAEFEARIHVGSAWLDLPPCLEAVYGTVNC